ncbi:MAG: magnesium/cobalt transporter CorA [Deltaproteobacteria bacterium]|nr:magnesium/cobalt transporter CorA [Deltaproteobacteria bacterium]
MKKKRLFKKLGKKTGLPPGSLVHIGENFNQATKIYLMDYNAEELEENSLESLQDFKKIEAKKEVLWINLEGLSDTAVIENIGKAFELPGLLLEDVLNTNQRPKIEAYEGYLFFVLKMLRLEEESGQASVEQVSLVLGKKTLISFQEKSGDVFESIRERIRKKKGKIRQMGADYLAYALVDAIVDYYFVILESFEERIENLEETIYQNPDQSTIESIYQLKKEIIFLRKSIWPLRELLNNLFKEEPDLISEKLYPYLRDVYDHAQQIVDNLELYREMLSSFLETCNSQLSHRLNEVMKVLTIVATLFIPLTFIAGIYGMNFKYMPELTWSLGYPLVWLLMLSLAGGMLWYFKKKNWF